MTSSGFEQVLTCDVCFETFNETTRCPRTLLCGHSFCVSCLKKLLGPRPYCPTCKARIQFLSVKLIPRNFSLLNVVARVSEASKKKLLSVGHCTKHDNFLEFRCMDCELWICSMCVALNHKRCETLLVKDAFEDLRKQSSLKVAKKIEVKNVLMHNFTESLRTLIIKRKGLVDELKRKEVELKSCECLIKNYQRQRLEVTNHCEKLKHLEKLIESSADSEELSIAIMKLDSLLECDKQEALPTLVQLPQTLEDLATLSQNEPIYALADEEDGCLYGKVIVKTGLICVSSFERELPEARIIPFKNLLTHFNSSSVLPEKAFLQFTDGGSDRSAFVVIKTDGVSARGKNFILLCSALRCQKYKGLAINSTFSSNCLTVRPGISPLVEGIRPNDLVAANATDLVYGTDERDSWFKIDLMVPCQPNYSNAKFNQIGVIISGMQELRQLHFSSKNIIITDCGLVI